MIGQWLATRSNFDRELLKKLDIIEPNLDTTSIEDISIVISPDDIALSQQVADQMYEHGLLKRKVVFADRINPDLAKTAEDEVKNMGV